MKIIVLTPIKNEAWILDYFLGVTSLFADCIIIADQMSTDNSSQICAKYERVKLISNKDENFNEADRQKLLIKTARELFPNEKRIFFALDADEIFTAQSLACSEWEKVKNAEPGTTIYLEKPDLFNDHTMVDRHRIKFPIGYVDDGCEHEPKLIHSARIPILPNDKKLDLEEIKVMHYGSTRMKTLRVKMMMYSMIECIYQSRHLLSRRKLYGHNRDFIKEIEHGLEPSPKVWFEEWEKKGFCITPYLSNHRIWYYDACINMFVKYGFKKFWMEDIWQYNWKEEIKNAGIQKFSPPPAILKIALNYMDLIYSGYLNLKKKLKL